MDLKNIKAYECYKCGYKWISRIPTKPIQCPKCKCYKYDNKKKIKKVE